jgi:hypothetical protein
MLIAAVPFLLVGALGVDYRSATLYLPFGFLCVLQFAFPTFAGWGLIATVYVVAVASLSWEICTSVIGLGATQSRGVFIDTDDTIFVVLLTVVAITVLIALIRSRPTLIPQGESLKHPRS